jgi:hypothetical protein
MEGRINHLRLKQTTKPRQDRQPHPVPQGLSRIEVSGGREYRHCDAFDPLEKLAVEGQNHGRQQQLN